MFPDNANLFSPNGDAFLTIKCGDKEWSEPWPTSPGPSEQGLPEGAYEEIRDALPENFNGLSLKVLKNVVRVARAELDL